MGGGGGGCWAGGPLSQYRQVLFYREGIKDKVESDSEKESESPEHQRRKFFLGKGEEKQSPRLSTGGEPKESSPPDSKRRTGLLRPLHQTSREKGSRPTAR